MNEVLREREGMTVRRRDGYVIKVALDDENRRGLQQAWRFLKALADTPFVPKPHFLDGTSLTMEYIEATPITDTELARRYATQMLLEFRRRNIIHGDLTAPNIIWRNNIPVVIDWDQSNFSISETRPQKRPKPDIVHLMPVLIDVVGDPSRVIRRWQGLRDAISYYFEWGTFLDLGTHYGDFVGLAMVEGMYGIGVDSEKIRECIEPSRRLWSPHGDCEFQKNSIVDYMRSPHPAEVIMLFSTWPYIYHDYGASVALEVLTKCIHISDVFLFETQLYGDGPGIDKTKTLDDVYQLLRIAGGREIEQLITIPVGGRDAERTVWAVKA